MYLRLVARETFQCRVRIKRVKDRLKGMLTDCPIQSTSATRKKLDDSCIHFKLKPTNFTEREGLAGSAEFNGIIFESDRISTDSGADTSDDEDLVQEVEIFYRNLKNWVAAEEKRKKKKGEKRIKTSQQADICTPSLQAKKASRNCDDGSCCPG